MRRRVGQYLKWPGLFLCVLLAALWVGSFYGNVFILFGASGPVFTDVRSNLPCRNASQCELWCGQFKVDYSQPIPTAQKLPYVTWIPMWIFFPSDQSRYGLVLPRFDRHQAVIPLWLPFIIIAIPTALAFNRDWKRRHIERGNTIQWVRIRDPWLIVRIPLAVFAGIAAFAGLAYLLERIEYAITEWRNANDSPTWFWFLLLCLWLTATYALARLAFDAYPWRLRIFDSRPRCTRCMCDLMGNVSGVCPQCGTAVAGDTL